MAWQDTRIGDIDTFRNLPLAQAWLADFNVRYRRDPAAPVQWVGHVLGAGRALGYVFRALNLRPLRASPYFDAYLGAYGGSATDDAIRNNTGWFPFRGRHPNGTVRRVVADYYTRFRPMADDLDCVLVPRSYLRDTGSPSPVLVVDGCVNAPNPAHRDVDRYCFGGVYGGFFPPDQSAVQYQFLWSGAPFRKLILAPTLHQTLTLWRSVATALAAYPGGLDQLVTDSIHRHGAAARVSPTHFTDPGPAGWNPT